MLLLNNLLSNNYNNYNKKHYDNLKKNLILMILNYCLKKSKMLYLMILFQQHIIKI